MTTPKKERVRIYTKDLKAEITELRALMASVDARDFSNILDLQKRMQLIEEKVFNPPPLKRNWLSRLLSP